MRQDLIDLRTALGWKQSDVARATGLTQPVISQIERGRGRAETLDIVQATLTLEQARRHEAREEAEAAAHLEALAAAMPDSPQWQALRAAIKERALDHLDRCEPAACDALLEMIPAAETQALLDAYFDPPEPAEDSTAADQPPAPGADSPAEPPRAEDPAPMDTTVTPPLADRIDAFLDKHACIRRSYVPGEDDPEERFNGPDTAMMASASALIRAGKRPHPVHSNWYTSGCYRIPDDRDAARAAQAEHDALNGEINRLARAQTGSGMV